jgi:hypothetical protein
VIFGSGAAPALSSPRAAAPLIERRIGVETMDTAAACRTYNVLASEGRSVVAALLPCRLRLPLGRGRGHFIIVAGFAAQVPAYNRVAPASRPPCP